MRSVVVSLIGFDGGNRNGGFVTKTIPIINTIAEMRKKNLKKMVWPLTYDNKLVPKNPKDPKDTKDIKDTQSPSPQRIK